MFYDNSNGKFVPPNGLSARALNASQSAATAAQSAAQSAANAAQLAAQSAAASGQQAAQAAAANLNAASKNAASAAAQSVRQGVYSARGWAAPRLEQAADYTTSYAARAADYGNKTLAPRVSGALRSTARQVSPEDPGTSTGRSVLQVILLSIAALAGAGAIAALIQRQRAKSALEKETESDVMNVADANEPGATVPGQQGAPAETAGVGLNGKASSSRW